MPAAPGEVQVMIDYPADRKGEKGMTISQTINNEAIRARYREEREKRSALVFSPYCHVADKTMPDFYDLLVHFIRGTVKA